MVTLALSGKVLYYRLGSHSEDHDHYGPLWLLPLCTNAGRIPEIIQLLSFQWSTYPRIEAGQTASQQRHFCER